MLAKDGVVTEVTYPYLGDLLDNGYDYIYLGGHEYSLSDAEVTVLIDNGYGEYIHYP